MDDTFSEKGVQKQNDGPISPDLETVAEFREGVHGIPLVPKPAPDALDPLNFTKWEKAVALSIVMFMSVSCPK